MLLAAGARKEWERCARGMSVGDEGGSRSRCEAPSDHSSGLTSWEGRRRIKRGHRAALGASFRLAEHPTAEPRLEELTWGRDVQPWHPHNAQSPLGAAGVGRASA